MKHGTTSTRKTGASARPAPRKKAKVLVRRKVREPLSLASKAKVKAHPSIDYADLVRQVVERGKPVRVPGRPVALMPLHAVARLRKLEQAARARAAQEAEDRADAEAFRAHEREPGEWKPWSALRSAALA